MHTTTAAQKLLRQLADLLDAIKPVDFSRPCENLGGGTIGQHVRHTLEFFLCLESGCRSGVVNYDRREHDKTMEVNKDVAADMARRVMNFLTDIPSDRSLRLETCYHLDRETFESIDTNARRELVYNIEHGVHHMAIMRIGIREVAPYIPLDEDFGVAASTIRYSRSAANVLSE